MPESHRRVALITGGSRGIGLGIAQALARNEWDLAINGVRTESEVQTVLQDLRSLGAEVVYCQGDVGQAVDRSAIIATVKSHFNQLHLVVNNAGITSPGRQDILNASEEAFDRVMAVNLKGAFFLTQIAARWMIEQREQTSKYEGCVINISSISGEFASSNRGDYCISWSGMTMLTKLWAARLGEYGMPVYEIRPGIIRTDMTAGVTEKYDRLIADGLTIEPRWGTPEDVGRAVVTLARGDLPYATGNYIMIDGGMSVGRL